MGLPESTQPVESRLVLEPGRVYGELAAYLSANDLSDHPLVPAVLRLAARIDDGTDPLSGLATALRQLQSTLVAIEAQRPAKADPLTWLMVKRAIRRTDPEVHARVVEILTPEFMDRVIERERAERDR